MKLSINVTETRQNWFEIPDIFRLAAKLGAAVHVNHCIFPEHCVLYTLPLPELKFVLDYLRAEKGRLEHPAGFATENAASYEFLLANLDQSYRRRADLAQRDGIEAALSQTAKGYVQVEMDATLVMPSPHWVLCAALSSPQCSCVCCRRCRLRRPRAKLQAPHTERNRH